MFNSLLGVGLLLLLAGAVGWEALDRFRHPVPIQTWLGHRLLRGRARPEHPGHRGPGAHRDRSLQERDTNLRAAYLHALGTASPIWRWWGAWSSSGSPAGAGVDPVLALAILAVILRGALLLLRDAVGILMHRAAFEHEVAKAALPPEGHLGRRGPALLEASAT
ncbi:MAG: hypothetical protein IPI84_14330 [Holophagaceae bacterium]|nr:hypothetical protein [Holophagaceae bacterium]